MKIVNCIGGLGNQLFQYSFYMYLKRQYPTEKILFDTYGLKNYKVHNGLELNEFLSLDLESRSFIFNRFLLTTDELPTTIKILRKLLPKKEFIEHCSQEYKFIHSVDYLDGKSLYFKGYWQNYKYIEDNLKFIKSCVKDIDLNERNKKYKNEILSSNSVSIHVRRGDYVDHPLFSGVCEISYYQKAIEEIKNKIKDAKFFIFTNDPKWVEENFVGFDYCIVSGNKKQAYVDLYLMMKAKNSIIANSSFSWWGALLKDKEDGHVIAPQKWNNEGLSTRSISPNTWQFL